MANANTNTIALFNLQTKQENDYSFLDNILLCQNKINAKIVSVIINTEYTLYKEYWFVQYNFCPFSRKHAKNVVNKTFPFCYSSLLSFSLYSTDCAFFCYVRTMTLCSSGFSAGSKHRE